MAYTVSNLRQDLTGMLHGTDLNKVKNLFPLINRSAREVLEDIDPAETKRTTQLENALYDKVFDYVCPTDVKGDRIIDIRPQVNRYPSDRMTQTYSVPFDMNKDLLLLGGMTTINWNTGVKSLRIAKNLVAGTLINGCESVTDNGTWVVGGTASNISTNTINYVAGGGSIEFDLAAGADPSSGYVENTTSDEVDLTDLENAGAIFAYVYLPDEDPFTSFTLRWGSSSSNFYSVTVTANQDSTAFQVGWNLLRFDWLGATVTGTPDVESITYLRLTCTYDGTAAPSILLDNIVGRLSTIYEIVYYSKFLFRNSTTGAFQENASDNSDIVNLDTDSYNILLWKTAQHAAEQIQAQDSSFDTSYFEKQYDKSMKRYQAKYKSEVLQPSVPYYRMTSPSKYKWNMFGSGYNGVL